MVKFYTAKIIQPTKSKILFELFQERVIVSAGDYFCCIHIFSAKLLISSQTFFSLKYSQKLETYECDVRLICTPMCGGRICHLLLTVRKTHRRPLLFNRQQTLYWLFTQTKLSSIYRNKPIVTYTYLVYWALMKREALLTVRRNSNLQS